MTPTVLRSGPYRFYFFSREESRRHVHITCADGEAKFWLEPIVGHATSQGLSKKQLKQLQKLVEEHAHEINKAWQEHFGS